MKFTSTLKRLFALGLGVTLGLFPALLLTSSASAVAVGVGDVSSAVRYAPNNTVFGVVATEIEDEDDEAYLIEAPWPMNFFGRTYDGICVTSNGTVSPVVYDNGNASCDDDYDEPLADLAASAEAPVIAAFSNDNDLGETVRGIESTISSVSVSGSPGNSDAVVTVRTSSAHGLTTGDTRSVYFIDSTIDNNNPYDNRVDYIWLSDQSVTVVDATHFQVAGNSAESGDSSYTPNYPSGSITVDQGWVWDDSSEDLNGVDDGVGKVNTIYVGTTTIGGRDAWVYTNYRSVGNDGDNPDIFTNTFQIVLIKRDTVNGETRGYDFDIEYNYGAVKDGDDGYDDDSGTDCEYLNSHCRTGVGLVDWNPISEVADVYELFASTPGRDLVDGYPTGMTSNRLNSTINGRYTFRMVGGVVQNFAVPVMDGTGNTEARPEVEDPLAAVPDRAMGDPTLSSLTVDGTDTAVTVDPNGTNDGIVGSSGDLVFSLSGLDPESTPLNLDADGNLILNRNGFLDLSGEGFSSASPVKVYIFSEPTFLGMLYTDDSGEFTGTLQIPEGLDPGVHDVQVVGYNANGDVLVFTVGVVVPGNGGTDGHGGSNSLASTGFDDLGVLLALSIALLAVGLTLVNHHRRTAR